MAPRITLFSASPRRRELLGSVGIPCRAVPVDAGETPPPGLEPGPVVEALALRKLEAGLSRTTRRPGWSLAADTLVAVDGRVLGKPGDREEARRMLESLSGRTHGVFTGLAVNRGAGDATVSAWSRTAVTFRALDPAEIASYLDAGEWRGAAGAYRVQERGAFLVEGISGEWSTVVGLPLGTLYGILTRMSYPFG